MAGSYRSLALAVCMCMLGGRSAAAQEPPSWMKVSRHLVVGTEAIVAARPTTEASKQAVRKTRRGAHLLATGLTFITTISLSAAAFSAGGFCSREMGLRTGLPFGAVGTLFTAVGAWQLSRVSRAERQFGPFDRARLLLNVIASGAVSATPFVVTQITSCD